MNYMKYLLPQWHKMKEAFLDAPEFSKEKDECGKLWCKHTLALSWDHYGQKSFYIDKNLIEDFRMTTLPHSLVFQDYVKLPYDSMMIENPDVGLGELLGDKVIACIVTTGQSVVDFVKNNEDFGDIEYQSNAIIFQYLTSKKGKDLTLSKDTGRSIYVIEFEFKSDTDLGARIQIQANSAPEGEPDVLDNDSSAELRLLSNLIINTLLWINDPSHEVHSEERKNSILSHPERKGKKRFTEQKYIYLRHPRPGRSLIEAAGSTDRKMLKRFTVRGHWRDQACGVNFSERRKRWILPFWKGPSVGEVVSKKYVLKPS